jgi:hypothetical protein
VHSIQAWDRYAYVRYNPLKYVDPSGNFCVETQNDIICSDDFDDDYYYQFPNKLSELPGIEDIFSRESWGLVTTEMREVTRKNYDYIRRTLFHHRGWEIMDRNGKIKDQILIAIILGGEANSLDRSSHINKESVEAASNQYYDKEFDSFCSSNGCTIDQQISWLYTYEFTRKKESVKEAIENFSVHVDYAKLATINYVHESDESWLWGNVKDPNTCGYSVVKSIENNIYPELPWFIVYRGGLK